MADEPDPVRAHERGVATIRARRKAKKAAPALPEIEVSVAPPPVKPPKSDPKPDTFVGPDGRTYRRIHVQRNKGWIDKTELVG